VFKTPIHCAACSRVHGAVRQALTHLRQVLAIEINSATDNPLVFPEERLVLWGGIFMGSRLPSHSFMGRWRWRN
jgi:histidine ammonia-lyase